MLLGFLTDSIFRMQVVWACRPLVGIRLDDSVWTQFWKCAGSCEAGRAAARWCHNHWYAMLPLAVVIPLHPEYTSCRLTPWCRFGFWFQRFFWTSHNRHMPSNRPAFSACWRTSAICCTDLGWSLQICASALLYLKTHRTCCEPVTSC